MVTGLPICSAVAEKDADFHFVVQALARPEIGRVSVRKLALAVRAADLAAADTDRGRPAVIADRYMLIVGKKWRCRAKEAACIRRVLDRRA